MADSILGSAEGFAVLGGSGVTNTGPSVIVGSVGSFPTPAVTGFIEAAITNGVLYTAPSAVTDQAQIDLARVYNGLAGMIGAVDLSGQDLGGQTLVSGVYHFDTSAQLTGVLNLDAQGNDNAFWVIQIGSTLTTASDSAVQVINPGLNDGRDYGLFWQIGSSATIGVRSAFEGNIVALTSITMNTGSTISNGRALAMNGAVSLDSNCISRICPNGGPGFSGGLEFNDAGYIVPGNMPVPEPCTFMILSLGLVGIAFKRG
ncbi:MAG: DUF3494 domain-containing protein [Patescibacteria group bacterium]